MYVDDQEKALRFYTQVAGPREEGRLQPGAVSLAHGGLARGPGRRGVAAGAEQQPGGRAYQQATFQRSQPAAIFFTSDLQADYERMKARGAEFTMPPTDMTASKIAMLKDTSGNLIQITQLLRG